MPDAQLLAALRLPTIVPTFITIWISVKCQGFVHKFLFGPWIKGCVAFSVLLITLWPLPLSLSLPSPLSLFFSLFLFILLGRDGAGGGTARYFGGGGTFPQMKPRLCTLDINIIHVTIWPCTWCMGTCISVATRDHDKDYRVKIQAHRSWIHLQVNKDSNMFTTW